MRLVYLAALTALVTPGFARAHASPNLNRSPQYHLGLPVLGGETVRAEGWINASVMTEKPAAPKRLWPRPTPNAQLTWFCPRLFGMAGRTRLVWMAEQRGPTGLPERTLIDAAGGEKLLTYSLAPCLAERRVFAGPLLARGDTDPPTGDAEVDEAYEALGDCYRFFATLGRNSFDGADGPLVAVVRAPAGAGAYWLSAERAIGLAPGFAHDDIVAHEFAHGVTQFTAKLEYFGEPGAINEGLSDIFGELIDLENGRGLDNPENAWTMGEGLRPGGLRNLADPMSEGRPDRYLGPNWHDTATDGGGVHHNSGVISRLAFLVCGQLGASRAAALFYETQSRTLTASSGFTAFGRAVEQAAMNLNWTPDERAELRKLLEAAWLVPVPPQTLFVRPDGDDANDGLSWATAKRTPQAALALAPPHSGWEVWLAEGAYNGPVTLRPGVSLLGGFTGDETSKEQRQNRPTVLEGGDAVISLPVGAGPETVVDSLILQGGTGKTVGAYRYGGGLYVAGGAPSLRNLVVQNSSADFGGGLYAAPGARPRLENCRFADNHATYHGGALFFSYSGAEIVNSRFDRNSATLDGGAIGTQFGGGLTLDRVRLEGNTAGRAGAALFTYSGPATLVNSLVAGNRSPGAAVAAVSSPLQFTHATFADNPATALTAQGGSAQLVNCILTANAGGVKGPARLDTCVLFGNGWDLREATGENLILLDPRLAADFKPSFGSPCINAGRALEWPTDATDLAGVARRVGPVDLGAFEMPEDILLEFAFPPALTPVPIFDDLPMVEPNPSPH